MKTSMRAALFSLFFVVAPLPAMAEPVNLAGLKTLVEGLGYPSSPVGTDGTKIVITYTASGFNVPIGLEVTASKRFIWATANLGASKLTGEQALALLKRSGSFQPTQFWITSAGNLMVGLTVENDDLKPERMRSAIQKLGEDISTTADLWQASASTTTP